MYGFMIGSGRESRVDLVLVIDAIDFSHGCISKGCVLKCVQEHACTYSYRLIVECEPERDMGNLPVDQ